MKQINQQRLLKLLDGEHYRVDTERGMAYFFHKGSGEWRIMKTGLHSGKYQQMVFYIGEGLHPKKFNCYLHNVVFIAAYGPYDESMWKVYWKDGNRENNRAWNLDLMRLPPRKEKKAPYQHKKPMIRAKEIKKIKRMLTVQKEENCVRIAESLQLYPRAVQRTVRFIKLGIPLKYENKSSQNGKKWLQAESEELRREKFVKMNGFDPWLPADKQKESPYKHLFPLFNTGT